MKEIKKLLAEFESKGEARNVKFNLARCHPSEPSIEGDVLVMTKVESTAKYRFWDPTTDRPKAGPRPFFVH